MTLDQLLQQETDLVFESFNYDDAFELGCLIRDEAVKRNASIAIDITIAGQQRFFCALPGTSNDNTDWIRRKMNTVNRYGHSSYYIGEKHRQANTDFWSKTKLDPNEFAAHGGCFPIIIKDTGMIGTVTVSGLPQLDDHTLVTSCIEEFLKT